jgi:protein involved in polysaccharide export with SLBB domain
MVKHPANPDSLDRVWRMWLLMPICLCFGLSGCNSILSPINAVPAERIPPQFLAAPQANKRPIDVSLLRNVAPPAYILDKDDILGVFIETILGQPNEAPPVHIPDRFSDLSPGIGFPIPVRDDGTVSLPLIEPIPVRGLTVAQVEELVKRRYVEDNILVNPRVIVTLLRKRTYRVFVVRQDGSAGNNAQLGLAQRTRGVFDRSDLSSRSQVLQLPAYENDVLNALSQTGGLPGLNAKAEVTILRGDNTQTEERFRQMQQMYGEDLSNLGMFNPATIAGAQSTVTIPLRVAPDEVPNFRPEDVILRDGDVVYVESRDTEVYYTGGLLGGGEWPIPRDYDLDVLGAVALAGRGVGVASGTERGLIGGGNQVPPTDLIILRKLPGNRQIAISVDLTRAINDPRARLLVNAGDTLLLRYKPEEELVNFGISAFFTYGIRELFRN